MEASGTEEVPTQGQPEFKEEMGAENQWDALGPPRV